MTGGSRQRAPARVLSYLRLWQLEHRYSAHMVAPTSRADRRGQRRPRALEIFGSRADAALDVLELLELAWHDCYNESSPPEPVIDDIWVVSRGDLAALVSAAHLAVTDFRDLRLNADALRDQS